MLGRASSAVASAVTFRDLGHVPRFTVDPHCAAGAGGTVAVTPELEARQPGPRLPKASSEGDRPPLQEVAVRTSQHPSPRRFRCVRVQDAGPGWPFFFSRLLRQAENTEAVFCPRPQPQGHLCVPDACAKAQPEYT